jgi:apolipoprotein N-acyltransferase
VTDQQGYFQFSTVIRTFPATLLGAAAAGACLVLALPPFSILPLAIIAFSAFALLLQSAPPLRALGIGFLFGLGQFVPGLFWITESFQVEAQRFGWIALPAVIGLSSLLSVFPALACAFAARMVQSGLPPALSLATCWMAFEWLRGHVFTGFPWNLAAYTLADWPVAAQSAALVGSYGLGFLLVLLASLTAQLLGRDGDQNLRRLRLTGLTAIAIGLLGFGAVRLGLSDPDPERGTQIRIVQPNIEQSEKWDEAERTTNIMRLTYLSARSGSFDLLLWPETAWQGFLAEDTGARTMLSWLLPETGVLLTGSPERDGTGVEAIYRNSILTITPDGEVLTRYAKHHLVPFGEYVPWRSLLPFTRLVESLGDFTPGPGPRTLAIGPHPYVGAAICYEAIFPGHVVDDAIRPDWIFNATNDAWFGTTIGPWQHLASVRMRAIEEGLPLVRAANTGVSAIIDAYGRTRAMLELGKAGIIDGLLPQSLPSTAYARFGDWSALVLVLLAWAAASARAGLGNATSRTKGSK